MVDKHKKDAGEEVEEKGDPKELKADSRWDSDANIAIRNELSDIQSAAETSCSAWGEPPDAKRTPRSISTEGCASVETI
jgi:hypothetical protein